MNSQRVLFAADCLQKFRLVALVSDKRPAVTAMQWTWFIPRCGSKEVGETIPIVPLGAVDGALLVEYSCSHQCLELVVASLLRDNSCAPPLFTLCCP